MMAKSWSLEEDDFDNEDFGMLSNTKMRLSKLKSLKNNKSLSK